ncbi:MAG: metal ABC transporter permease, partial [bacterium]|nr:metal ABC transporter permease [bacterium]
EESARVAGVKTRRVNAILLFLTAVTVVLAVRVVGIMLISALLILPAVTALQVARGFRGALLISVLASVLSVLAGITLAFFLDLPAGATIVMLNFSLFVLALFYRRVRIISLS